MDLQKRFILGFCAFFLKNNLKLVDFSAKKILESKKRLFEDYKNKLLT
ncbi:hypothetical protein NEOC95_001681 [Neochlamydia sp. AcF95]|nr:hypothetical protein [Neochlamydia sp. AcF95]